MVIRLLMPGRFPFERLVFGSHTAFHYPKAAALKLELTTLTLTEIEGVLMLKIIPAIETCNRRLRYYLRELINGENYPPKAHAY